MQTNISNNNRNVKYHIQLEIHHSNCCLEQDYFKVTHVNVEGNGERGRKETAVFERRCVCVCRLPGTTMEGGEARSLCGTACVVNGEVGSKTEQRRLFQFACNQDGSGWGGGQLVCQEGGVK